SDARLKSNIVSAPSQLSYLTNLPLKQFTVNASGETKIGTIAQELLALPDYMDLVSSGSDGFYKVAEVSSWKLIKGIQELDLKMASLSEQFSISNSQFSMNASISNVSNSLFQSIISMFKDAYEIVFEKGLIRVAKGVFDTVEAKFVKTNDLEVGSSDQRTGITIYDKITGQPVCVVSEDNVLKSLPGRCDSATPAPMSSPTPEPSLTPTPSESSTPTPEATPLPSEIPTPSPTPEPSATPMPTPEPTPQSTPEPT
ncbi:MAG: endoglucanase, partial [Parcubacteria group bacterium Gr01-1014_44]